jgi:hypothetical protein
VGQPLIDDLVCLCGEACHALLGLSLLESSTTGFEWPTRQQTNRSKPGIISHGDRREEIFWYGSFLSLRFKDNKIEIVEC